MLLPTKADKPVYNHPSPFHIPEHVEMDKRSPVDKCGNIHRTKSRLFLSRRPIPGSLRRLLLHPMCVLMAQFLHSNCTCERKRPSRQNPINFDAHLPLLTPSSSCRSLLVTRENELKVVLGRIMRKGKKRDEFRGVKR